MQRFCKIIIMLFFALALTHCDHSIPDFKDTLGHTISAKALRGKWVIVNYWAPWCEACAKEIPELNAFAKAHATDVMVYGVDFDQPALPALKEAVKNTGMTFPVLTQDPGTAWHLGAVTVLPTTFIINPEGKVVNTLLGANTQQKLADAIHAALVK